MSEFAYYMLGYLAGTLVTLAICLFNFWRYTDDK